MGYITLADAKAWLNVVDASEDAQILAYIEAASTAISKLCNREFSSGTVTEVLKGSGTNEIFVNRPTVTAVTSVVDEYGNAVTSLSFDSVSIKRTDGIYFSYNRPYTVTYTGGYTSVPADVQLATKMTVQAIRNAMAMDPNLMGESLGGAWSGNFDMQGPGGVPRNARSLLSYYTMNYTTT